MATEPPPITRPLYRSLGTWQLPPADTLTADDYQRRKSMRELEMAFTVRSTALHRHRFD